MSETEFKELIKKRSVFRGRLTKCQNYLNSFKNIDANTLSSVQVREISLRLESLQDLLRKFDDVQTDIENMCPDEDEQLEEREKSETLFYSAISSAQELVMASSNRKRSSDCSLSKPVKLPTIQLPTFKGDYLNWLEFKDTFDSLINSDDSMPHINKFHYLRSSLEGSAAVIIKSIEFTSQNYKVAWDLLCLRYDNKQVLINNHLKALFNIDSINKESYKCLRYLIDNVSKNLRALNTLGQPTEKWDALIIHMVSTKLDLNTSRKWEEHKGTLSDLPTLEDFYSFLRTRANVLETTQVTKFERSDSKQSPQPQSTHRYSKSFMASVDNNNSCLICNQSHLVYQCPKFKAMNIENRLSEANKLKICHNCLRPGHNAYQCRRKSSCQTCKRKHNSLLHKVSPTSSTSTNHDGDGQTFSSAAEQQVPPVNPVSLSATVLVGQVLLCTALVNIFNEDSGVTYQARALLDSGSQSSFIIENLKNKLKLTTQNIETINVSGINDAVTNISTRCSIRLSSRVNSFSIKLNCLVLPTITNCLPAIEVSQHFDIPENVVLADPTFFRPCEIDILLGADVFWEIMGSRKISLGKHKPTLLDSKLGWLVSGPIGKIESIPNIQCKFTQNLDKSLKKFWEIEEIQPDKISYSIEEQLCENHYVENSCRLPNGKFSVKIPFRESPEEALGDSFFIAQKRFINLERK